MRGHLQECDEEPTAIVQGTIVNWGMTYIIQIPRFEHRYKYALGEMTYGGVSEDIEE